MRTLAAGFFDGVHLAHRRILDGADAALTFANHPATVLAPGGEPPLLCTLDERVAMLREAAGEAIVLDFTPEFAATRAEDFARGIAERGFTAVRCGEDWRFGRGGEGGPATLRAAGLDVETVPAVEFEGARISSTRIRAAVAKADFAAAAAMLGREWTLCGAVARGKGLGAKIGFPTVNVAPPPGLQLPPRGVYAVEAAGAPAIANLGLAPTLGANAWRSSVLEVHFIDSGAAAPLAAANSLRVAFRRFIRPEKRFDSIDALRRQIAEDVRALVV